MTLQDIKQAQPSWFSPQNKKFFGDISYKVLQGKRSKDFFLVRKTFAWSDMLGLPKKTTYRLNAVNQSTKEILSLMDDDFDTIEEVKEFLKRM